MTETAIEIARREADEAEAADDDEEVLVAAEPEPEPEPEPPTLDERDVKSMETEESRHRKAVQKIMGEGFAGFEDCPLCTVFPAGFVPAFAGVPDELAAQLGSAVANYFEGTDLIEPPYPEAKTMMTCPDCDGWGQVRSGARNALHRIEICPPCMGNGYVAKIDAPSNGHPSAVAATSVEGLPAAGAVYADAQGRPTPIAPDIFGQPWGTPSYGSAPGAPEPVPVVTP